MPPDESPDPASVCITPELRGWIEARAVAAGFDLSGIAPVPRPDTPEAAQEHERFTDWVAAGRAGEMHWLKRENEAGQLLRADLLHAMPWARSVIVCAVNYNAAAPRSLDAAPPSAGWIARYAWSGGPERSSTPGAQDVPSSGADYHDLLLTQLRQLESELRADLPAPELQTRCYVDTGPILERSYAARAGIGWIGRNTCVLNQHQGSWLLLGVIVTSLPLAAEAVTAEAPDRCGTCTRCVDACPTGALLATPAEPENRQMDAPRCIAYLTIEKKGSLAPVDPQQPDFRPYMGRHVFGCDICQEVCPWNRRAPITSTAAFALGQTRRALVNPALDWLATMDGAAFNRWFRGSPLERTGRKRILRNVAIAMGNSGDMAFQPQLHAWAAGEDPILAESAAWALRQLAEGS